MATVLAVATALSALIGIIEKAWNAATPTPAQTDQGIDAQEQANKQSAENTGKPV